MLQSQLFSKTRKEAPKDEVSKNAQLLIRAGYIHKEMAGVYAYLPLGLRVLDKICNIIREEMNAIGGQELLLTGLQPSDIWKKTGRWSDEVIDVWFKTEVNGGGEVGLGTTHEEPITVIMSEYISSYKDLPRYPYQFQTKFRNELRAKSGIMRTREFIMKDLYSFSRSEEEFREFYEKCAQAYLRIFERTGLGDTTFRTFASGGSFSKFSDEFQTVSEVGEDTIYLDRSKKIAVNKEVYKDEVLEELGLKKSEMEEVKATEVGNIFPLSTRFAEALDLKYRDEKGEEKFPIMGCYGIGPGRLMGAIVEIFSDEKGLVWPKEIAPFKVHLISLGQDGKVKAEAAKLYEVLQNAGIDVLYDDREDKTAGEKFAESDLLGIPYRVVVSEKTLTKESFELKERTKSEAILVTEKQLLSELA